MPEAPDTNSPAVESYYHQTRRPLNNLAMLAPLLVIFHLGAAVYGMDRVLLAPEYVQGILQFFGAPFAIFLPAAAIASALFGEQLLKREKWTIHPSAVAGMAGESVLWTLPLIAIGYITGKIATANLLPGRLDEVAQRILVAIGAGVYEEFIFRMLLIMLILLVLVDVCSFKKDRMTVLAIVMAAALFALCHFRLLGGGEDFNWSRFIFLATAGVLWGGLFIYRGLGIAAGAHIMWDIFVLLAAPRYGTA
jgi:hypothetical protein